MQAPTSTNPTSARLKLPETKHELKQDLQLLAEYCIQRILGPVPRKQRREAARRYANEARRQLEGLDPLDTKLNRSVISWVVREFDKLRQLSLEAEQLKSKENQDVAGMAPTQSNGDDVGSPTGGPTAGNTTSSDSPTAADQA